MEITFYVAAAVALVSTAMVITRLNAVHALLYLIVSLLSVATIFFVLGSPFTAALEVIIYAGAIMVLFVFVVMLLNMGPRATEQESRWLNPRMFVGPGILAVILVAELIYALATPGAAGGGTHEVGPKDVGTVLYTSYAVGVELAGLLLLAGIVGASHLGRRPDEER